MSEFHFKGCKHLNFNQEKFDCELVKIGNHAGWERRDPTGNIQLCQMCDLRGRLNSPTACIGKGNAMCSDYEEKVW